MKNNTSFYRKQHVVLESIFCSIGKSPKLGIRCEKLKNRDHQRYTQERGADCSYPPQKCLKLYCQLFCRNGGLYILRYKALYQYGVRDGERSRGEAAHTFLKQTYIKQWNFDLKLGQKKSLCAIT